MVRIIAGSLRRTPLPVLPVAGLRPTPQRVRQTLFDWLAHLRPDVATLRAIDVFAGTGALGLELASRGAAHVVLIERDAQLLRQLRATVARLRLDTVEVLGGDALRLLPGFASESADLIFLDPPFDTDLLLPALCAAPRLLRPGGLIYAEAPRPLDAADLAALGLGVERSARAGQVRSHLLRRLTG